MIPVRLLILGTVFVANFHHISYTRYSVSVKNDSIIYNIIIINRTYAQDVYLRRSETYCLRNTLPKVLNNVFMKTCLVLTGLHLLFNIYVYLKIKNY